MTSIQYPLLFILLLHCKIYTL